MFRLTRRAGEHIGLSAQRGTPVYFKEKSNSFWRRRLTNFQRRGPVGKSCTVLGYGAAGLGAYVATCLLVRTFHQPSVEALFFGGEDYVLEDWHDVEPTLQPGDVILMRGNGLMSWIITTLQFTFSFLCPAALRYSHVAVVVAPAIVEWAEASEEKPPRYRVARLENVFDETPSNAASAAGTAGYPRSGNIPEDDAAASPSFGVVSSARVSPPTRLRSVREQLNAEEALLRRRPVVRRGAIILEAMDNKDYDVPDVTNVVSHDVVQMVEASRRIFSVSPHGKQAYRYFAVRRLQNYEHTPEQQEKLKNFCVHSVGRRMDGSVLYPLAFLHTNLHELIHPLRRLVSGEVSCSELIVELYQELGIVQRRWRWVPLDHSGSSAGGTGHPSAPAPQRGAHGNADLSLSLTSLPNSGEGNPSPQPTLADETNDRCCHTLHVYDYIYGKVDTRDARAAHTPPPLPPLPAASPVENGEVLASPALRARSLVTPLQPHWPQIDALKEVTDFYGRTLRGPEREAACEKMKTRTTATYFVDPYVPVVPLRAGDVAKGADGRDYQLQWYYSHDSVATCPFHFTEGAGESVIDFAMNVGLGPELYMRLDRRGPSPTAGAVTSETKT